MSAAVASGDLPPPRSTADCNNSPDLSLSGTSASFSSSSEKRKQDSKPKTMKKADDKAIDNIDPPPRIQRRYRQARQSFEEETAAVKEEHRSQRRRRRHHHRHNHSTNDDDDNNNTTTETLHISSKNNSDNNRGIVTMETDDSLAYSSCSLTRSNTTRSNVVPQNAGATSSSSSFWINPVSETVTSSPSLLPNRQERSCNHCLSKQQDQEPFPADERILLSITPPSAVDHTILTTTSAIPNHTIMDQEMTLMTPRNNDDEEEEQEMSSIAMAASSALAVSFSSTITSSHNNNLSSFRQQEQQHSATAYSLPSLDPSIHHHHHHNRTSKRNLTRMNHKNNRSSTRNPSSSIHIPDTTIQNDNTQDDFQVVDNNNNYNNDDITKVNESSSSNYGNVDHARVEEEAAVTAAEISSIAFASSISLQPDVVVVAVNHDPPSTLQNCQDYLHNHHGRQTQQNQYHSKKNTHTSDRNTKNHNKNKNNNPNSPSQQRHRNRKDENTITALKYHHYDWSYGEEEDDEESANPEDDTRNEQPEESFQEIHPRIPNYPAAVPEPSTLPNVGTQAMLQSSSRWVTPPKHRTSRQTHHSGTTTTAMAQISSIPPHNNHNRQAISQALPPPTSPSSSSLPAGHHSPGRTQKKLGKMPPPSSSSVVTANRMMIENDCLVIVGRGKDQKSFYHSRFILSYASEILAHHLERANYVLRIPHKRSSEWEHLKVFLEPHAIQRATVHSSNMPVLLPWFRDLQLTVLLQDCDKLLLEGILFPSSSSSVGNTKIAVGQENLPKWTRIRNWQQDVYNIVLSTKIAQASGLSISCRTGFLAAAEWMQTKPELFVLSGHSTTTCLLLRSMMKLLLKCIRSTASTSRNDDVNEDEEDPRCEFEPPQASNLFASLLLYLPPDCVTDYLSAGTFPQVKSMLENPLLPFLLREGILRKYEEEGLEQSLNDYEKTTTATTATETMPASPCSSTIRRGDNHHDGNEGNNNSYSEEEYDDDPLLSGLSDWAALQHVAGEMQAGIHKLLSQWSSSSGGAGCPIQKKTSRDSHRSNSAVGEGGEGSSSMNRQQRMEWLEEIWRNLCTPPIFETNLPAAKEAPRPIKTEQPTLATAKSKAAVLSNGALSPRVSDLSSLDISKRTFVC